MARSSNATPMTMTVGASSGKRPQAERQTVGQISGQVDDQQEFERFGGLEVNAAAAQPGAFIPAAGIGAKNEGQGGDAADRRSSQTYL